MAQSLNCTGLKCLMKNCLALCTVLGAQTSFAEVLLDPTRAPTGFNNGVGIAAGATPEPVLQSVFISSQRSMATISGQIVRVGDIWGDAIVISMTENDVVLQRGKALQTLHIFPAGKWQDLKKIMTKPVDSINKGE